MCFQPSCTNQALRSPRALFADDHDMRNTIAFVATLALALAAKAGADEPKLVEVPYKDGALKRLTIAGRKAYVVRPTTTVDPARALDLGHAGVSGFA